MAVPARRRAKKSARKPAEPLPVVQVQLEELQVEVDAELAASPATVGGGWTIPLMCLGIGLIACCLVIPQAELNRKLRYEQRSLTANLDSIQRQVSVNDGFLKTVMGDPTLAERLAWRQMKTIRKGQKILAVKSVSNVAEMSPFSLVAVSPPVAPPAYQPVRGTIADLCNDARSRLYLMGIAMTMVAAGLVLGFGAKE